MKRNEGLAPSKRNPTFPAFAGESGPASREHVLIGIAQEKAKGRPTVYQLT
jgi:hypothetical protein